MKDLLVLTADKDAEFLIKTLLARIPQIENTPVFSYDIITHPQHDPGVVNHVVEYIRPYSNDYSYLLVTCDYEGSGFEDIELEKIELKIEESLHRNGWADRNKCILINPEIESWLWVHHSHLHNILDWQDSDTIYGWIKSSDYECNDIDKPIRPKEAFESVLKKQKIPRSSSLYAKLAETASYKQCIDPAFKKFIDTICQWFKKTS